MIKKTLAYIAGIIIFILLISFYGLLISIFPKRHITDIKPSDLNLRYKNITLKTSDSIRLKGWFIPNNKTKKAVIVCHGYPFDKGNVLSFAPFLHEKYNLFFFDFRAMGESEGRYTTVGYNEVKDLEAAVSWMKKQGMEDIGAIGFSLGAATIMMAKSDDIKAIVSDSSYANLDLMIDTLYRQFFFLRYPFTITTRLMAKLVLKIDTSKISPETAIKDIRNPILLIHGKKDSQIRVENAYRLQKANPKAELWVIEEAGHGQAHYLRKEKYEKKVLDFFGKNLR